MSNLETGTNDILDAEVTSDGSGRSTLHFTRKLITGDSKDVDILIQFLFLDMRDR